MLKRIIATSIFASQASKIAFAADSNEVQVKLPPQTEVWNTMTPQANLASKLARALQEAGESPPEENETIPSEAPPAEESEVVDVVESASIETLSENDDEVVSISQNEEGTAENVGEAEVVDFEIDPQDLNDYLRNMTVPEACLIKSKTFGDVSQGDVTFDNSQAVLTQLNGTHTLTEFNICADVETFAIHSIQLTFDMADDEDGSARVVMPRVGPERGQCEDIPFGEQKHAEWFRLYRSVIAERPQVTGLGIVLDSDPQSLDLIKLGRPSFDADVIYSGEEEFIMGFIGATNDYGFTQVGFLFLNTTCTEQIAMDALKEIYQSLVAVSNGVVDEGAEDEGSMMIIIVVASVSAVIVIIVIVVVCIVIKKRKKVSNVQSQVPPDQESKKLSAIPIYQEEVNDREETR